MYDVTWYWVGGAEVGAWHAADVGTRDAIRRGGRVAHDGRRSIGPPEGPPSVAELREVLGSESWSQCTVCRESRHDCGQRRRRGEHGRCMCETRADARAVLAGVAPLVDDPEVGASARVLAYNARAALTGAAPI